MWVEYRSGFFNCPLYIGLFTWECRSGWYGSSVNIQDPHGVHTVLCWFWTFFVVYWDIFGCMPYLLFESFAVHTHLQPVRFQVGSDVNAIFRFFWGGLGVPIRQKFCQSPHPTLVPIFWPRLVPPSRGSSLKIWKFKYIFVSNLTSCKLKSTWKSCFSCLKLQKMA